AQALLVDLRAGRYLECREDSLVPEYVELVAVDNGRRNVRTAALRAPRKAGAFRVVPLERDVAGRAGLEGVDRLDAAVAVGDDDEPGPDDRRGDRNLGIARVLPQLLPGVRIVPARERRRLRDELRLAVRLEDRGGGPRRDLVALRAPHVFAGRRVERRDEGVALDVALHDHEILVDDRRAADAPLVIGIEEPAGVEHAEILLPQELSVEVVRIQPLRTERHDHLLAVGDRCRRRLARFRMPLRLRDAFVGDFVPDDLSARFVDRDEMPGVLRGVADRFDVAVEARPDALRGIAADGGRDEHAIAPDDWTRHRDAGDRRLPCDVLAGGRVPLQRGRLAVGDARRVGAAERRPVLPFRYA